jgi:thiol-disulfide isomerase/thioredoxin
LKKMIIFLIVIIALFAGITFLTKVQNEEKVADNPYKKETLDPNTIAQLDDPNYQNIILPENLEEKLADDEDITVYFYSPTCPHCQKTTPIVAPLAKDMNINLAQYNLLEFEQGWDDYRIESTPTIVQYKNGKETARIVGYNEESVFRDWFNQNTKNK